MALKIYHIDEGGKTPTFWLLLKAKQKPPVIKISGKLLLIIQYYMVHRKYKLCITN